MDDIFGDLHLRGNSMDRGDPDKKSATEFKFVFRFESRWRRMDCPCWAGLGNCKPGDDDDDGGGVDDDDDDDDDDDGDDDDDDDVDDDDDNGLDNDVSNDLSPAR